MLFSTLLPVIRETSLWCDIDARYDRLTVCPSKSMIWVDLNARHINYTWQVTIIPLHDIISLHFLGMTLFCSSKSHADQTVKFCSFYMCKVHWILCGQFAITNSINITSTLDHLDFFGGKRLLKNRILAILSEINAIHNSLSTFVLLPQPIHDIGSLSENQPGSLNSMKMCSF